MKKVVKKIFRMFWTIIVSSQAKKCGKGLKVNFRSKVTNQTILRDNVNFNGMQISGLGEIIIGDNFHSGKDCQIITSFHNFDNGVAIPYDNTYIHKNVIIGDNVWLGTRVIILGGVTIGEGVIIQAGSVVVSNIPDYAVAGGHPAKPFKYRNIDHYAKLKEERKFH